MAEQSHRDEMNAAIRAQRERQAAPRTIAPVAEPTPEPAMEPEEAPVIESQVAETQVVETQRKSMLDRLRGR
jgi:hypothetical protein